MGTEKDEIIKKLYKKVQEKKAEIAKAEKPNWETNLAFRFSKNSSDAVNLQVCGDVEELVSVLAFLIEKKNSFDAAQAILGTKVKFRWFGYTYDEWVSDIKTRATKIEITNAKKDLEALEARLNKLDISKEMREEMELEEISKLLDK